MKRLSYTTSLAMALVSITFAVTGCGSSGSTGTGVGGVAGGVISSGAITALPGGGAQISFSGANVFDNGVEITAVSTGGQGISQVLPSILGGSFYDQGAQYAISGSLGYLTLGSVNIPVGQAGTMSGTSHFDPGGSSISMVATQGASAMTASIAGILTLSPTFMQANPTATTVQGLYIDMFISGNQIYGGLAIICSVATCQHGAYLQF